jgi:hypothetical protein
MWSAIMLMLPRMGKDFMKRLFTCGGYFGKDYFLVSAYPAGIPVGANGLYSVHDIA